MGILLTLSRSTVSRAPDLRPISFHFHNRAEEALSELFHEIVLQKLIPHE
jgi:hypothetical protein